MIEIENNKKNKMNKKIMIIIVSVVAFIVTFIVTFALTSPSNSYNKNNNSSTTTTPVITNINMGETFEWEGLKFTIESYEFRYFAHKGNFRAEPGKIWLMVNAKIENPSAQRKKYDNITSSVYYITEDGEAKYSSMYYNYAEWLMASNYLDPYEIASGYFMYSISETVVPEPDGRPYSIGGTSKTTKGKNFEIRFQENSINPSNIIKIKL